jgi:hypothetical protein
MPGFIFERSIAGTGTPPAQEIHDISAKSNVCGNSPQAGRR